MLGRLWGRLSAIGSSAPLIGEAAAADVRLNSPSKGRSVSWESFTPKTL
jgi:hypothetical protein